MFDIKIYYSPFNVNSTHDILFWPSKYISINEQIFMYPIYTKKDKCVESIEKFLKYKNEENLNLITTELKVILEVINLDQEVQVEDINQIIVDFLAKIEEEILTEMLL